MFVNTYPSKLFEQAVNEFSRLPGIGRKTAIRLVLHLLKENAAIVENFGNTIIRLRNEIKYCTSCNNISETETCEICSGKNRNHEVICVVEDIRDVMAIENTSQYNGMYHILGGIISPMDGIGPSELNIDTLIEKAASGKYSEMILALPATIEGDTTNFYLYKKIRDYDIMVTSIARGVSFGDELEFADEVTLGRSILNRIPYQNAMANK
jgi:recombination protein RecR